MRVILVVDEMLAVAVRKQLDRDPTVIDRQRMRDLGRKVARALRDAVLKCPSVLVIGSSKWDALPMLRRARLPRATPVVLITPSATWERQAEACRLGVVSILPADDGAETANAIAAEINLACQRSSGPLPVLVQRQRRPPRPSSSEASILAPRVAAWDAWAIAGPNSGSTRRAS